MKILPLIIGLSAVSLAAEPSLKKALADAIYAEEVDRDPKQAATQYARIVEASKGEDASPEERIHAAAALFRLAEIRERQGREDEAKNLYREYFDDFSDVGSQAGIVRAKLGAEGLQPSQRLTEFDDSIEGQEVAENVFRKRWNFRSKLDPDQLLLTTFETEHHEKYANEGLPAAFSIRTLHHAPSGEITNWFSRTQVHWSKEVLTKRFEENEKKGVHEWRGYDHTNVVTGFGQMYRLPDGLHYSGGGWGNNSMAFFFTDEYSVKPIDGGDYEEVEATKRLTVRLKAEIISVDRARKLLAPLKVELPAMDDEAWSRTLPPNPDELGQENP